MGLQAICAGATIGSDAWNEAPREPRRWEAEIALTVGALLRWPPLREARVIGGEAGLDREVSWPVSLRVRPPAFEPLSGHELALVSIEALRLLDESLSLAQLIGRLVERGVAGVVVVGPVDAAAIEQADRARVPVLQLAETFHLADLGPAISRVIAEQRARLYQLGLDVHHQLAEVSMAGRGLPAIVERVAELAGRAVVLQSAGGDVLVRAAPPAGGEIETVSLPLEALRERFSGRLDARAEPPTARLPLGDQVALAVPIVVREEAAGYLTLLGTRDDFGDDDQIVLTRGSLVCALELAKQEAVIEAERRLRGDFVDALLAGEEGVEELFDRARHLGYDLDRAYAVLAIVPERLDQRNGPPGAQVPRLAREVGRYLAGRRVTGFVGARRQGVALFLAWETPGDAAPIRRFAAELRDYLAGPVGIPASIGFGRYAPGLVGLRTAFREAEQASAIGREFFGPGEVTGFGDLGVYRLLYTFRESDELRAFCDETLAALVAYDRKNGTALVETLEVYFRCHASLHAAAEALVLHRNSLAYRLRRISEITGLDLDNLEDRFRLQLALKGRRLVGREGARSQEPGVRSPRPPPGS